MLQVTNHSDDDTTQPGFSMARKLADDYLGIVAIEMSSQCLLVTGYLRICVNIPEVKVDCRIEDIRVSLLQTWLLQSLREESRVEEVPALDIPLWSMQGSSKSESLGSSTPPHEQIFVKEGCGSVMEKRFVFPEDDRIRATTSLISNTGLKASHQLSMQITYSLTGRGSEDKELKMVKIAAPVTMSMCACAIEALQLPAYDQTEEILSLHQRACDQRAKARRLGQSRRVTLHC